MSDANDLSIVMGVFDSAGIRVERVPTADARRCDLRAVDEGERYLIEVKGFHEDEAINKALRKGAVFESTRSFDVSNSVEGAIREAVKQLRETSEPGGSELRLVCLLALDKYDADVVSRQILGVLYGMRSLLTSAGPGKAVSHDCLYFAESAFFTYRDELDAAMVIDAGGATVLVNDHGHGADRIQNSRLGRFFAEKGAFYDERTWERDGRLVADCDFDRSDGERIRLYVEGKYGLGQTIVMEFKRHSAMAPVQDPNCSRTK